MKGEIAIMGMTVYFAHVYVVSDETNAYFETGFSEEREPKLVIKNKIESFFEECTVKEKREDLIVNAFDANYYREDKDPYTLMDEIDEVFAFDPSIKENYINFINIVKEMGNIKYVVFAVDSNRHDRFGDSTYWYDALAFDIINKRHYLIEWRGAEVNQTNDSYVTAPFNRDTAKYIVEMLGKDKADEIERSAFPSEGLPKGESTKNTVPNTTKANPEEEEEKYASDESGFTVQDGILIKYQGNESELIIPEDIKEIGEFAFEQCEELTSIVLPESIISIGEYAFDQCRQLVSVTLSNNLTTIGPNAFTGCESLTSIRLPDTVIRLGYGAFEDCNSLIGITIPLGITALESDIFRGCESLTTINIPEGVETIEWSAFEDCSSLTEVVIPSTVKTIGKDAFSGCNGLKEVIIPEGVVEIGESCFWDCSDLASIIIPDSVEVIGEDAFWACDDLVIKGRPGSVSEAYANEYDIPFEKLD